MHWRDHKTRLRRFLRDPDGNIWTDAFLLRCFNDEQRYLQHKTGILENIQALRVPPQYQMSYTYDWEWQYRDQDGKTYQCFRYHHQSNIVCAYRWEAQLEAGLNTGESDSGDAFSHPFEAWEAPNGPNKHVPIWFPIDFYKTKYIAWDREPIDYVSLKDIQSEDPSWIGRKGKTFAYSRFDEMSSNEFFLYPVPSSPVYDDIEGYATKGMTMFFEDDTVNQEFGTLLMRTGAVSNQDFGLTIDVVEADDNILLIYEAMPTDIEGNDDESDFPVFLRKYIEYGTLQKAYSANTDGKIDSLKQYWEMRKQLGLEAIKRFKSKRKIDRDYRLTTRDVTGFRTRKEPKLPDEYPATTRY